MAALPSRRELTSYRMSSRPCAPPSSRPRAGRRPPRAVACVGLFARIPPLSHRISLVEGRCERYAVTFCRIAQVLPHVRSGPPESVTPPGKRHPQERAGTYYEIESQVGNELPCPAAMASAASFAELKVSTGITVSRSGTVEKSRQLFVGAKNHWAPSCAAPNNFC